MAFSLLFLAALCTILRLAPAEKPSCVGNECEYDTVELLAMPSQSAGLQPKLELTDEQCNMLLSHYFINYCVLKTPPVDGSALTEMGKTRVLGSAPGAPVKIGDTTVVDSTRDAFINGDGLAEFLAAYSRRPDTTNVCGMQVSHSFAVWHVVRSLKPTAIIESGVNAGHSTWIMRAAAPQARIISIDPSTTPICGQQKRWIDDTNNEYLVGDDFKDFAEIDWGNHTKVDPSSTLVFFDDHQESYKRIAVLQKYGFKHVMFEDNYPEGEGDLNGWSLKQVFQRPDGNTDKEWLLQQFDSYAEFPPVLLPTGPPCFSDFTGVRNQTLYAQPILDLQKRPADQNTLRQFLAKA